jgi:hypothetical protein
MSSEKDNTLTPATGAPSILQQRITLIVFLAVIGAVVWWQNAGDSLSRPVQKFLKTPLPDVVAELNFTLAEAGWSTLQFDSQKNLQINALTESALLDTIALMDEQTSELPMARMTLLLEKQFGTIASQQIMALLPVLKHYKEIEKRWWEENGSNNLSANKPPDYAELFQLQDELLGETMAKLMFSEQRRLLQMMLASQQIRNDSSLTQAEKDQALLDLQTGFQDSSQESAPNEANF